MIHYYDTVLQTLNGVTVPSFNKVVKTFYWQAASAYPDGVLSFQTSPLPLIASRYYLTVAGRKYYLSVRSLMDVVPPVRDTHRCCCCW